MYINNHAHPSIYLFNPVYVMYRTCVSYVCVLDVFHVYIICIHKTLKLNCNYFLIINNVQNRLHTHTHSQQPYIHFASKVVNVGNVRTL